MKAGRELDALIAEKVMGIEPWPDQDPRWRVKAFKAPIVPSRVEPKPCEPPEYSIDIAAAWGVVEKLKHTVSDLEIELSSSAEYPNEWEVAVKWLDDEQGYGPFYFTAPTAPHAICLAALKTVGVES